MCYAVTAGVYNHCPLADEAGGQGFGVPPDHSQAHHRGRAGALWVGAGALVLMHAMHACTGGIHGMHASM